MAQHIIQHFILNSNDLLNGFVTLSYDTIQETINAQIRNSFSQFKVLDFNYDINSRQLSWSSDLSNILAVDDVIIVDYDKNIVNGTDTLISEYKEESIYAELTSDNIVNDYITTDVLPEGAMSPVKFYIRHSPTLSQFPEELSASFSAEFSNFDYTYGFGQNDLNQLSGASLPSTYCPSTSGNSIFIYWKDSALSDLIGLNDVVQINYINPSKFVPLFREIIQVSKQDIYNNYLTLSYKIDHVVEVLVRNGPAQLNEYDFRYNPLDNYITFNNLAASLSVNDNIEIAYYVSNFSAPEILKKNEDFSYSKTVKSLAVNPRWTEEYSTTWNFFEATQDKVFTSLREKTLNFNANIRDPELCNIRALDNLAIEVDFPKTNIIPLDKVPPELERLLNIFSVNRTLFFDETKLLTQDTVESILSSQLATDIYPLASLSAIDGTYNPTIPNIYINTIENKNTYPINLFTPTFNPSAYLKNELLPFGQIEAWSLTGTLINDLSASRFIRDSNYLSFMRQYYNSHLTEKLSNLYLTADLTKDYSNSPSALLQQNLKSEAYEYLAFLDTIWPCSGFCYKPAYSGEVIDAASYLLTDASLRFSYKRENIKLAAQRYSIAGTPKGAKKLTEEELRRNFTKPSCWRLLAPDINTLTVAVNEQKDNCIAATSAEYISEKYFPDFCGISGLTIEVVEYNDKTNYLNLSANSLDSLQRGGNYRFWETQSPSANNDYELLGLSGTGYSTITGNLYFEYVPTKEQILQTFLSEYAISTSDFSLPSGYTSAFLGETNYPVASAFVSGMLFGSFNRNFLPALWDKFAISHLTGEPTELPDLASIVEPTKSTVDMLVAELKYLGTASGTLQASNFMNSIYPTVAPAPTLENMVEIDNFRTAIPLTDTILPSQTLKVEIEEHISPIGIPIESWKTMNQDLNGYQTNFEQSYNLDYNQQTNDLIDRDGPFISKALSALLDTYTNDEMANIYNVLKPYYRQVYGWMDAKTQTQYLNAVNRKLGLFTTDVINLSGRDWHDIDNTIDYTVNDFVELTGQRLTSMTWDQYNNHYCLYKGIGTDNLEAPSGRVFIRLGNEPLPFPASISWIPISSSIQEMSGDLINQYSLADLTDTNTSVNAELITSGLMVFYKEKTDGSREEIMNYFPHMNYARIADWRCMQLYIPADAGYAGLDDILQHCYSIGVHEDIVYAVGQRHYYNEETETTVLQDVLIIFGIEYTSIPIIDGTTCCNIQTRNSSLNILSVSSKQTRILQVQVLGEFDIA